MTIDSAKHSGSVDVTPALNHLIEGFCPVYGKVREKYDYLENDEDLIKMFNEIQNGPKW